MRGVHNEHYGTYVKTFHYDVIVLEGPLLICNSGNLLRAGFNSNTNNVLVHVFTMHSDNDETMNTYDDRGSAVIHEDKTS